MKFKYGEFSDKQISCFSSHLHSMIHWLLVYAEEGDKSLPNYFEKLQIKLAGINNLFDTNGDMVQLMALIESAKLIYVTEPFDWRQYRKMILDAHSVIDHFEDSENE